MRNLTNNVSGMFVYTCSQLTVLIIGNHFKFKVFVLSLKSLYSNTVLSDDLGEVARLVHDEAGA
jgi:hypothetical protein